MPRTRRSEVFEEDCRGAVVRDGAEFRPRVPHGRRPFREPGGGGRSPGSPLAVGHACRPTAVLAELTVCAVGDNVLSSGEWALHFARQRWP